MRDLPDAPWIRDAEQNGMPEPEPYNCPVCGAECPEWLYRDKRNHEILGCDICLESIAADDYFLSLLK